MGSVGLVQTASDKVQQESRIAALEARLSCVEEEHRAEVSRLKHALEECVSAIGTCARAIDTMCLDSSIDSPQKQFTSVPGLPFRNGHHDVDMMGRWENAAAAMRDAANLGKRALNGATEVEPVAMSRRQPTPVRVSSRCASGASSVPTPISVEVMASTASTAGSAQSPCGQRRYLVAAPLLNAAGRQCSAPHVAYGAGAGTMPALSAQLTASSQAWGSLNTPAQHPPAALLQPPQEPVQQRLLPPNNGMLGIPGLSALSGVPCVLPVSGPPSGRGDVSSHGCHFSPWSSAAQTGC